MNKRFTAALKITLVSGFLLVGFAYTRYIDWPAFADPDLVRVYLPEPYPLESAYHYRLRSFMDTWELYRFTTTPEGVAYLVGALTLESQGLVYEFPLIVSKPPPHWWDPERLQEAEYFSSRTRAPDGHLYDLLYSPETGTAYLIRFDG